MTTLFVLDYLTFDATHSTEKEFADKASVYAWLLGQRESDFHYITLFHGDNEPVDGWSDVIEFCRPIKPLTALSVCGDACNCMKCNPTKTLCNASCGVQEQTNPVTSLNSNSPQIERFSELPDGAYFRLAYTDSNRMFQKVMNDGEHNAVWVDHPHIGELIPAGVKVIRA